MKDFIQEYNINEEVNVGKGSALLFRPSGETKYRLFLPLESTPFVEGDTESHEFKVTTSNFIGKVAGYTTIDDKDIDFIVTRDFIDRLKTYKGEKLDFLSVLKNGIAQQFTAEYTFKINDATDDIVKGTIKFISTSVGSPLLDVRELIMETIWFTNVIPSEVVLATATGVETLTVETSVASPTITVTSDNSAITGSYSEGKVTITGANAAGTEIAYGMVTIKAEKTGYANWQTKIAVEVPKPVVEG
jgi:hypothetical protein